MSSESSCRRRPRREARPPRAPRRSRECVPSPTPLASPDLLGCDLALLLVGRRCDELVPPRDRIDARDSIAAVVHVYETADVRAVGDRRLSIERATMKLDRDASGGGFQRGPLPRAPLLRSFCARSALRRFFSALSRFGPF